MSRKYWVFLTRDVSFYRVERHMPDLNKQKSTYQKKKKKDNWASVRHLESLLSSFYSTGNSHIRQQDYSS